MRYTTIAASAMLLSGVFASCTCHKEVAERGPSTFEAPPAGFHVSGSKITPPAPQGAQTSPTPARVAEAPEPTPPADVPSDFPADVPIFKDAKLAQVQDLANNAHNVIFRTEKPVAEVFSFYEGQMQRNGWKVTQRVDRGAHAFISFRKGDMIANLTIAEDPQQAGKQIIAIMYEKEQPLPFEEF